MRGKTQVSCHSKSALWSSIVCVGWGLGGRKTAFLPLVSYVSTCARKLISCACLRLTGDKKQRLLMEPHRAKACQRSQPQLPAAVPKQPPRSTSQKSFTFLSCAVQGKVLPSCVSPHKPLNTSTGLQQREGDVYNYPRIP